MSEFETLIHLLQWNIYINFKFSFRKAGKSPPVIKTCKCLSPNNFTRILSCLAKFQTCFLQFQWNCQMWQNFSSPITKRQLVMGPLEWTALQNVCMKIPCAFLKSNESSKTYSISLHQFSSFAHVCRQHFTLMKVRSHIQVSSPNSATVWENCIDIVKFPSLPAVPFFGETSQKYYHSDPLTLYTRGAGGE